MSPNIATPIMSVNTAQPHAAQAHSPLIGVFDSGVGGLSVLRALHQQMPMAPLWYVADSGHAPYGDRDPQHVVDRSHRVSDHLVEQGARMIVVACNTATARAVDALRSRHPGIALVGVEPGVKPAAAASQRRCIAVMATPSTLASPRYADLVARHAPDCVVHPVPCSGLAAAIERGEAGRAEVDRLLDQYCKPLPALGVDTVVLGCTHYPFVADRIALRLGPDIQLLDTADAVARRALDLVTMMPIRTSAEASYPPTSNQRITLQTTGEAALLRRMTAVGLGQQLPVEQISI
ncbi:glutamate racemase [Ideonella sp. DXS29W]|uniref:Glutamate racemase n=1 Tax=Ideonella lacteola TaxID=2984193 RepID=A0ABU9BLC0_9BURK